MMPTAINEKFLFPNPPFGLDCLADALASSHEDSGELENGKFRKN
jgi:hypothetical protein